MRGLVVVGMVPYAFWMRSWAEKRPGRDQAPGAVPAVDGDGVQRVVQVQQDGHLAGSRRFTC